MAHVRVPGSGHHLAMTGVHVVVGIRVVVYMRRSGGGHRRVDRIVVGVRIVAPSLTVWDWLRLPPVPVMVILVVIVVDVSLRCHRPISWDPSPGDIE
jgi:hypothetical protein